MQFAPEAKEYGITMNLENMLNGKGDKIYAEACSDITLACRYVNTLNSIADSGTFGFCLDTGHALLCSLDIKNPLFGCAFV